MDIKRFLPSIIIAIVVMFLYQLYFRNNNAAGGAAATTKVPYSIYTTIPEKPLAAEGDAKPELITLGDAGKASKDKLAVTINNVTAGIEQVQLNINDYAETVKRQEPLTLFTADPDLAKPFSTLGIHITLGNSATELPYGKGVTSASSAMDISRANSTNVLDMRYVWKSLPRNAAADDVVLSMTFEAAGKPTAEVLKSFHIDPASYEMIITHTIHNLTDQPITVQIDQLAGPDLPRDDPQMDDRLFHAAGLDSIGAKVEPARFNVTQTELLKFIGGTRNVGQFSDYTKSPALWIATSNRFFAAITRPLPSDPTPNQITLIDKRTIPEVKHISSANIDVMRFSDKPAELVGIIRLTGAPVTIEPGKTILEPLSVYIGPKKRDILAGAFSMDPKAPGYAFNVYDYTALIQFAQGCYSFCVRDFVVWPILWLLDFLARYVAFHNYGLAIMILVIVVRAALHPLTRASQINMAVMGKKMKDVQPLLESAKKRYAKDSKKLQEEQMRIYRENDVNPAGPLLGCLPMLIQMPIWAALYGGLRADIDLRHASFIPGWINDLSNPDRVLPAAAPVLGHPLFTVPIIGMDLYGLNLLPILLAAVFVIQMKVTTASQPKPADESQAQMQKMSQYMIFLFPLFLYNAPSGLNLYIFASTMGGLVDTYLVRKTLKKKGILPATAETLPTHEEK